MLVSRILAYRISSASLFSSSMPVFKNPRTQKEYSDDSGTEFDDSDGEAENDGEWDYQERPKVRSVEEMRQGLEQFKLIGDTNQPHMLLCRHVLQAYRELEEEALEKKKGTIPFLDWRDMKDVFKRKWSSVPVYKPLNENELDEQEVMYDRTQKMKKKGKLKKSHFKKKE